MVRHPGISAIGGASVFSWRGVSSVGNPREGGGAPGDDREQGRALGGGVGAGSLCFDVAGGDVAWRSRKRFTLNIMPSEIAARS